MTAALLFALAFAAPPADTVGTVGGEVRSEVDDAPLAGVRVELAGAEAPQSTSTDEAGRYLFRGVPAGLARLRAERLDFEPLEVEIRVPRRGKAVFDLALRPRTVTLDTLGVGGDGGGRLHDTATAAQAPLELTGAKALESAPPLTGLGPGEPGGLPPGQTPVDPSEALYVRGAPADLKRVLLDGAPVLTPFHLSGLIDTFQPALLRSATLYLGGAPARYDGGLSYVLDLSTRAGRPGRLRSTGALDALSARAVVEGSVPGAVRYLAGARTTHGIGVRSLFGGEFPYLYREGLLRLDAPLGTGALSVTGFANRERVSLDTAGGDRLGAGWENAALSARYHGPLAGADAELVAAASGFDAELAAGATGSLPLLGRANQARLAADFTRSAGPVRLGYGGSWERLTLRHTEPRRGAPLVDNPPQRHLAGDAAGAYLEGAVQPTRRLRLRGGARADLFSGDPAVRIAPRLSVGWLVADRTLLSAAAGRYHQHIRVFESASAPSETDSAATVSIPIALAVARASHLTLGLQQEPEAGTRVGLEGFFKTFDGVPARYGEGAYASGVDLWVRRETGPVQGWLGYSLAWVWSREEGGVSERFAGRQLLNAGASGALRHVGDLAVRFSYGAGLPFSPIPVDPASPEVLNAGAVTTFAVDDGAGVAPPPDDRADPYLRLDLALSRTFTPRIGGVRTRLSPYVKVLNALDRRDGLFYRTRAADEPELQPLGGFPLLPVFGVEWEF